MTFNEKFKMAKG